MTMQAFNIGHFKIDLPLFERYKATYIIEGALRIRSQAIHLFAQQEEQFCELCQTLSELRATVCRDIATVLSLS